MARAAGREVPTTVTIPPALAKRLELAAKKLEADVPGRTVRAADLIRDLVAKGCDAILRGKARVT